MSLVVVVVGGWSVVGGWWLVVGGVLCVVVLVFVVLVIVLVAVLVVLYLLLFLLLFGTLVNVCVYPLHIARAMSYLLILGVQTWRRGLALVPGIIPPQSCCKQEHNPHHADRIVSSCKQHRKHQSAPHDAISSTHVAEIE